VIVKVCRLVKQHLPRAYVDAMSFRMITCRVPLARHTDKHNKQPSARGC